MRPLSILIITGSYPPLHGGGYGLHMSWFAQGLAKRGHAIRVLTSCGGQDPVSGGLPVKWVLKLMAGGDGPLDLFRGTLHNRDAVRREILSTAPDVVFCGAFDGVGHEAYAAAIGSGVPCLTWLGDTWLGQSWRNLRLFDPWVGFATGGMRGGWRRFAKRAVGLFGRLCGLHDGPRPRAFAPIAAISQFVLDDLRKSGAPAPADSPLIPVCLHPSFVTEGGEVIGHGGKRTQQLRALFVGRMQQLKGPDVAIRGLAASVRSGADVRLTFAGLNIEQAQPALTALAQSNGVGDRIAWGGTPSQRELVELYRTHDVFLFPSRIVEGLGVVNCEAIACGLPVIGTAASGAAEVIITGETGFRVEIDDAAAIGKHLAELHADRGLLERISRSSVQFAHRFLPGPILDRLESELYKVAGRLPILRSAL